MAAASAGISGFVSAPNTPVTQQTTPQLIQQQKHFPHQGPANLRNIQKTIPRVDLPAPPHADGIVYFLNHQEQQHQHQHQHQHHQQFHQPQQQQQNQQQQTEETVYFSGNKTRELHSYTVRAIAPATVPTNSTSALPQQRIQYLQRTDSGTHLNVISANTTVAGGSAAAPTNAFGHMGEKSGISSGNGSSCSDNNNSCASGHVKIVQQQQQQLHINRGPNIAPGWRRQISDGEVLYIRYVVVYIYLFNQKL